ncbi:MAG: MFS transporter [Chloroflexota bacterium]
MSKKQLAGLFTINLIIFGTGGIVAAFLPLYMTQLGGDSTLSGLMLSTFFVGLAVGTAAAGRLSDLLQHRKTLLIAAGVAQIVITWLQGQVGNTNQLFVFVFIATFLMGIQLTLVSILAGLFAAESERGRVFGIIATATPLSNLIAGLAGGLIVERWGYSGLFTAAALATILQPIAALFLEDRVVEPVRRDTTSTRTRSPLLNVTFLLFFAAGILIWIAFGAQGLGRSLLMAQLKFDPAAISSTLAIAGLVGLPFPFVLGWLSDRVGRKPLLIFCYLSSALGLLVLATASTLGQFWIASALQFVVDGSIGVGAALVTDLIPQELLGLGLALFGLTSWIGQIIGSAITGTAIQNFGIVPTLGISAGLALVAVVLVLLIRRPAPPPALAGG